MPSDKLLATSIFILVYTGLMVFKHHRSRILWLGIAVAACLGLVGLRGALSDISWNVMGVFAGTLILAGLFVASGVPAFLADILINRSGTACMAMLLVCAFSAFISAFVENVATVLIVAPIGIEMARRLKITPVPFVIGIAIASNLEGTATLIGDPPSMILAAYERLSFNDFFVLDGRPGIFFGVQLGAVAGLAVLYRIFRRFRQPVPHFERCVVTTWFPTIVLCVMVILLALASYPDPHFKWFSGLVCMLAALVGWLHHFRSNRADAIGLLRRYDWSTTFFLAGVFVMVGMLSRTGVIAAMAERIGEILGSNPFVIYTAVVWISVLISAFIDNVPYITAMIPVLQSLSNSIGASDEVHYMLIFGLLIGSCLGGNITPVGASANIVAMGLLKKEGDVISFVDFARIGLPFTLAATFVGYIFIYLIWS
ncbi:MAG: SLC13 family permease [Candidatus Tritonobacter lacicola]|nr:SLC13 family permease [Candidatus Tritonobacter lacicola]